MVKSAEGMWVMMGWEKGRGEVSIVISYDCDIGPKSDGNGQTSRASDTYDELC